MPNPQLNIDSCFTLFLTRQSLFSIPHSPLPQGGHIMSIIAVYSQYTLNSSH